MSSRMRRERETVVRMIELYCQEVHGSAESLCQECSRLRDYALKRLAFCPFQDGKTTCGKCPVHCYSGDMKEKIIKVMKCSGPRMIWRYPLLALMHVIDGFRKVPVKSKEAANR